PMQRIFGYQFSQLQEVGHTARKFKVFVVVCGFAGHTNILPKLLTKLLDFRYCFLESLLFTSNAYLIPHNLSQLAVEVDHTLITLHAQQLINMVLSVFSSFIKSGVFGINVIQLDIRNVVTHSIGNNEISVG